MRQDLPNLSFGKNYWQARRPFRSLQILHPFKLLVQHFPVEKDQGAQSLVLSSRCNVLINCQVVQELLHFARAHLFRMLLAMKKDVTLDPIDISSLSPQAVMLPANSLTHLVE